MITLGQTQSDNNNLLITVASNYCYSVIFSKRDELYVITLSGFHRRNIFSMTYLIWRILWNIILNRGYYINYT